MFPTKITNKIRLKNKNVRYCSQGNEQQLINATKKSTIQ
jgi:hypothetical protein